MTLLRRIVTEKRAVLLPLSIALLANLVAYGLVVYPLGVKSATAADRAAAAAQSRQIAERDFAAARSLVSGKTRADEELALFYRKVLPPNLGAARRITYARLPALARKASVTYQEGRYEVEQKERNTALGRLRIRMALEGDYQGLREFLYELETTPEFIIVDDVVLAERETNKPLTLTLELSAYYRQSADGA
jgi:hypothetical protein